MTPKRRAFFWACLCAGAVLLWQSLTVHYNYHGNWTALFCSGSKFTVPPSLAGEHVYQFPNSHGYDGQFYHSIAHDPLLIHGTAAYLDSPALRARRILLPALAWLSAAGSAQWIDVAYRAWVLLFVLLGACWLGRIFIAYGRHPAWGMAFALVPATLISMDRMTVDIALAALCAGFVLYGAVEPSRRIYLVLALAPLARETGVLLSAAFFLTMLWRRRWKAAAAAAATVLPLAAWSVFLRWHYPSQVASPTDFIPLHAILLRTLFPMRYTQPGRWMMLVAITDYVALLGVWIALAGAVRLLAERRAPRLVETAAGLFALMAIFLSFPGAWDETFGFARIFTPLLMLVPLAGVERRAWWMLAPALLVLPRIGIQLGGQVPGIVAGLVR